MTGHSLYERMVAAEGLLQEPGVARPTLLRRAAREAAERAVPLLSTRQKRLLRQALLPTDWHMRKTDEGLMRGISLWCQARWDGAAPRVPDPEAAALLEHIVHGRLDEIRRIETLERRTRLLFAAMFLGPSAFTLIKLGWK